VRWCAALACAACVIASSPADAQPAPRVSGGNAVVVADWPHWRGPKRDGRADDSERFPSGGFHLESGWRRPLGLGYSSVSVAGETAVTLFSDKTSDFVIALDAATGQERWRHRLADAFPPMEGGSHGGPTATPTIHDGVVYALGPRGQLVALRLRDGTVLWTRVIDQQDGARRPFYGFTSSPLIADGFLILQTGGPKGQSITAFDRTTGTPRWAALDAPVEYESPILMTIDGVTQVVALNGSDLVGLLPSTGEVLWRTPHGAKSDQGQFSQPVPVGDRRLLVTARDSGATLFEITRGPAGFSAARIWNAAVFRRSYAIPVVHDGVLYGFNGSFMSAVDAATGKELWRSRPPGGQGLVLAGSHLVVFSPEGDVVIVDAAAAGYKEAARLNIADDASQATPSISGGRIFVRNLSEIAMVRVRPGPGRTTLSREGSDEIPSRFTDFIRSVEAAPEADRAGMVTRFMTEQKSFPIVEGSDLVHFVYRGTATDVALNGSMSDIFPLYSSVPLRRAAGTDFFYRSFRVPTAARWDYQFVVNFETFALDPLNPRRVPERRGRGELSEMRMPGSIEPAHLAPPSPQAPRGRIDDVTIDSKIFGATRRARVWIPPGYEAGTARLPLLVVVSPEHRPLTLAWMDRSLDNLVGRSVGPVVAAFIDIREISEEAGEPASKIAQMIAEEWLPALSTRYRVSTAAADRAMVGAFRAGLLPLYTALTFPSSFGSVGMQSLNIGTPFAEQTLALIQTHATRPLQVYIDWNQWEFRSAELRSDLREESLRVARALEDRGYTPTKVEAPEGSGWASWRSRTDRYLTLFFPLR